MVAGAGTRGHAGPRGTAGTSPTHVEPELGSPEPLEELLEEPSVGRVVRPSVSGMRLQPAASRAPSPPWNAPIMTLFRDTGATADWTGTGPRAGPDRGQGRGYDCLRHLRVFLEVPNWERVAADLPGGIQPPTPPHNTPVIRSDPSPGLCGPGWTRVARLCPPTDSWNATNVQIQFKMILMSVQIQNRIFTDQPNLTDVCISRDGLNKSHLLIKA